MHNEYIVLLVKDICLRIVWRISLISGIIYFVVCERSLIYFHVLVYQKKEGAILQWCWGDFVKIEEFLWFAAIHPQPEPSVFIEIWTLVSVSRSWGDNTIYVIQDGSKSSQYHQQIYIEIWLFGLGSPTRVYGGFIMLIKLLKTCKRYSELWKTSYLHNYSKQLNWFNLK